MILPEQELNIINARQASQLSNPHRNLTEAITSPAKTNVLKNTNDITDTREILLAILSNSGTLAGISLALVGIINLKPNNPKLDTFADDLYIFSALGFVVVCYLVFFAIRLLHSPRITYWVRIIDALFLGSLTMLVVAGFLTVYTIV
jgi:hypothetical protein